MPTAVELEKTQEPHLLGEDCANEDYNNEANMLNEFGDSDDYLFGFFHEEPLLVEKLRNWALENRIGQVDQYTKGNKQTSLIIMNEPTK